MVGKKLGIWMDHSSAHLIEFSCFLLETKIIKSEFTKQVKKETLNRSEHIMHNKEQHQQHEYYKQLAEIIKKYSEVLLFGPTEAKTELLNILKADLHFEKIKIEVIQTGKMTENQQLAFVKEHFSKIIITHIL